MASQTEPELDTLGATGRAQLVARMLQQIQTQEFELDVLQVANAADDDEPTPGLAAAYGERRANLRASRERIMQAYEGLMPEVRAILGGGAQ